jgi:hypothetical protein
MMGTIFERSHVLLTKWLRAIHLLCCLKKGISSHQLRRLLGVTLKTAWFMSHRIREAMRDGKLGPLGGFGHAVEAGETLIAQKEGADPARRLQPPAHRDGLGRAWREGLADSRREADEGCRDGRGLR